MPAISIVIPVYKVEDSIATCLDSVLAQTFTDWECLLVDDGSPDRSGAICDEYVRKDNRFKAFHKDNGGVSSARNLALSKVEGRFVTFIDSDDYIAPDFIASLYEPCKSDLEIDFVHGGCVDQLPTGEIVPNQKYTPLVSDDKVKLFAGFRGLIVSKLFKTDILREKVIRFDESMKNGEDMVFTIDYLAHCTKYAFVDTVGYYYVQREGSAMHSAVNYDYDKYFYAFRRRLSAIEGYRKTTGLSMSDCQLRYEQTAYCCFMAVFSLYAMGYTRSRRMEILKTDFFPKYSSMIEFMPLKMRMLVLPFRYNLISAGDMLLGMVYRLKTLLNK